MSHKEHISGGKEMLQCQGFACPGRVVVFFQLKVVSLSHPACSAGVTAGSRAGKKYPH